MCGVAGSLCPNRAAAARAVAAATCAVTHRGPDDSGEDVVSFGGSWLGLGHRRLSILDLSPLGHQPMVHSATGCQIVYNGEIYNYRRLRAGLEAEGEAFHGGSDTEVLLAGLARHGEGFLRRLEGMYAFGFFDPRGPTLLLARDPAGIKPLYLADTAGGLAFASEVRGVLATGLVKPDVDRRGLAGYLAYGAVQHPFTLFKGITSLPPGSCLTVRAAADGGWAKVGPPAPFWSLPPTDPALTEGQAVLAVREALDEAVRDHLISDVPIGLFLSSGIDSTILAGLATRHHPGLKSFTVVFDDQPDFSERKIAGKTAAQFGLDHTVVPISNGEAEAAAGDWLATLDLPSIDGLNVFIVSRAVRARGVPVALSGLGGDELFGGYPSFREVPWLRKAARLAGWLPKPARRGLAEVASVGRSTAVREKLKDILGGGTGLRAVYLHRRRLMADAQLARLGATAEGTGLPADFLAPDAAPDADADADADPADPVRAVSQLEFRLYQGNMLLRDADATGMASSLEIRVPFLGQQVVDLAHAIPGPVRLPHGRPSKHLLRRAFADVLRPEVLDLPKQGFTLPLRRWMAGPLRPRCERAISVLQDARLVEPDGAAAVWREFLAEPESPMWSRALALVVLGEYWRNTVG